MLHPSGLYAQSLIELWLPSALRIDDAVPPSETTYKNIASCPEAVRAAVLSLNKLIAGLRAETGRSDIPDVIPSDLNRLAYRQYDAAGSMQREIPMLNLEFVRLSAVPPKVDDEILREPHSVKPVSFARELLDSAKSHITSYNARRAVLDFAGAFEAFVADVVTPKLGNVATNTKAEFLRRYGAMISLAARAEIECLTLPHDQDPPRMPSPFRQLRDYRNENHEPTIHNVRISDIEKVMVVRNDAAHGRPIPSTIMVDLVAAVAALDELLSQTTSADH
jgi:hypothetical protein